MQASPNPDDERDLRTMVVADHGVDPSPVPRHKRRRVKPRAWACATP